MKNWLHMTRSAALALAGSAVLVSPALAQEQVLKLGSIFALTGPNASIGKEAHDGAQYAVRKLNGEGVEIGGEKYRVELVNVDDESKAERSVAAAERLVGQEDAKVIFTPPSSTTTLAVLPIIEKNGRVAVSFVAAAPSVVSSEFGNSFRNTLNSVMNVSPSVEFLIKEKGAKRIAYLGRNDDWGRASGEAIRKTAGELGAEVVVEEYFDTGSTDFYGLLTKVRAAEPDAVIGAAFIEDGVSMIKQYRELQMDADFLSVAVIWASPTFLNAAGDAVDGIYISTGPTTTESPELTAFKEQYQADTGDVALPFGITAYDTVMMVVEAMKAAGTTDPEKLAETLRNFEYDGLLQTYKFDNANQSQVVINVNRIEDGKVHVISSLTTQ